MIDQLIESRVIRDEGNEIFTKILIRGTIEEGAKDNYSLNYNLFVGLIEKFATNEPELFFWFIRNVLNKAILLPITADSQDTALTIFSTLNDRGLALSDADIFKAKIYNYLDAEGKANFIEDWQQLDDDAINANESIQKLFYYYMFYLRALENDRNTTTPGIRKYYSRNNFEQLYKSDLMRNLRAVLNLWLVINNRIEIEGEDWSKNIEVKQILDGLSSYPNEFWKYPVVIYYLKYKDSQDFQELFLKFLKKLLAVLSARYIVTPTINAVKRGILNLNAEIIRSSTPTFHFSKVDEQEFKTKIKTAHRNTVRMVLKILAYQNQEGLLPDNWEIEHILPKNWQSSYFPSNSDGEVKELVEHIGNKIPFEKKLNIIASNGYFKKKQAIYKKSKIQLLLDLSNQHNDWGLNEIRERDIRISDQLWSILNDWGLNELELPVQEEQPPTPTAEESKMIEELKRKGLI
ncbi:HNH endonuclease family protein [Bacillus sp. NPDC093026]|uniref:HNH endonuclease family protein n=1 Tax=Bacillus sp. NPDC093026 TaxID=3363948 RepID=UPI003830BA8C